MNDIPVNDPAGVDTPGAPSALTELRRRRGLSLRDCSVALKLPPEQLEALEQGVYDAFIAPVFARGHLRRYLTLLGADEDTIRETLRAVPGDDPALPRRVGNVTAQTDMQHVALRAATVGIAAVTVIMAALWVNDEVVGRNEALPGPEADPAALPIPVAATPLHTDRVSVVEQPPSETRSPPAATPTPVEHASPADPLAGGVTDSRRNVENEPPQTPSSAVNTLTVTFAFDEECWTEVTDAQGERLLYGLQAPGHSIEVTGQPPFDVLLGRSRAVRITRAGRAFDPPRDS
ncbi:MAG: RodZ domain-containing protein, partial [Pseudomonadota bacterium]|nr:RodZ domain-containing protein [Pseudomonadota bacterium]